MAEQVGISKSQVSREFIDAGERLLKELTERDFSEVDLIVIYLDGVQFGPYHVICAVGVDAQACWASAKAPLRTPKWPRPSWNIWSLAVSARSAGVCS
jgi:hypothetical protein